jgi:hypothetical protein
LSKRTDSLDRTRTDLATAADRLSVAIHLVMDTRPGIPGAQSFDGPNITSTARCTDEVCCHCLLSLLYCHV